MQLVGIFIALLIGFLVIGTIAAVHIDRHPEEHENEPEEPPRAVISQQVPPVFDTFKSKK